MSNQKSIVSLIKSISGQANVLTIPRIYLTLLDNNHRAALLLSQCVYWSDKTKDNDGWFYKTDQDWQDELGLPRGGLETALKCISKYVTTKIAKVYGTPKTHYRVDLDVLTRDIIEILTPKSVNLTISDLPESSISDLPESNKSHMSDSGKSLKQRLKTENTTNGSTGVVPSDVDSVIPVQVIYLESKNQDQFECPYCLERQSFEKQPYCCQCGAELQFKIPAIGGGFTSASFKTFAPRTAGALYLQTESAKIPTPHYRWKEFATEKQRDEFENIEKQIGTSKLRVTIDWAVKAKIPKGRIVNSILKAIDRHGVFEPKDIPEVKANPAIDTTRISTENMAREKARQEALNAFKVKK